MENLSNIVSQSEGRNGRSCFTLNREVWRKHFPEFYDGLKEDDFEGIYDRLYKVYEHNTKRGISSEPAPTKPNEFNRKINDDDIWDLESNLAIMYTFGLNAIAAVLDKSAGRPFLPRDPTTDGSYATAEENLIKKSIVLF